MNKKVGPAVITKQTEHPLSHRERARERGYKTRPLALFLPPLPNPPPEGEGVFEQ
jgi:hypothetical protein